MELGGEVAWDVQAEVDIPAVAEQAEKRARRRGTFGADGAAGEDLNFLQPGFGPVGALRLDADAGFECNVLAVFADDFDAAVFAGDGDLTVDQGKGGAAELA